MGGDRPVDLCAGCPRDLIEHTRQGSVGGAHGQPVGALDHGELARLRRDRRQGDAREADEERDRKPLAPSVAHAYLVLPGRGAINTPRGPAPPPPDRARLTS